MQTLKPGHVLGDYTIIRFVARGGMGEVYEAHDNKLDRKVALKVVYQDPDGQHDPSNLIRRFMIEARNLAKVNHPNVVTIHAIHNTGDTQYIAMEYVDGLSLKDFLEEFTIKVETAAVLFEQILSGVKRLHEHNIIHRDLKPSNILIRVDGQIKILDFGIAKTNDGSSTTNPGHAVGTPFYMAPELRRFHPASFRSDLWSVGAIFYETLTGRLLSENLEGHDFKFSASDREVIPEGMRALIASLAAPDVNDRYARASEAIDDLQSFRMSLGPLSSSALAEFHAQLNAVKKANSVTAFEMDISPPAAERIESSVRQHSMTPKAVTNAKRPRSRSSLRKERSQRLTYFAASALALVGAISLYIYDSKPVAPVNLEPAAVAPAANPPPVTQPAVKREPVQLFEPGPREMLWLEAAQNPLFSWSDDGEKKELQIAMDSGFQKVILQEEVGGNSALPSKTLPEGNYFWRLRSLASGSATPPRRFSVGRLEPVIALSPKQNFKLESNAPSESITFEWACRNTVRAYRLQVAEESSFSRPMIDRAFSACSSTALKFAPGDYYWRVRPQLPKGLRDVWGQTMAFTIARKPRPAPRVNPAPTPAPKLAAKAKKVRAPTAAAVSRPSTTHHVAAAPPAPPPTPPTSALESPLPLSPALGIEAPSRNGRISLEFTWLKVDSATSYIIEIARDPGFRDVVQRMTSNEARALLEHATLSGRVYWRVRALGPQGRSSSWSDTSYLEVH